VLWDLGTSGVQVLAGGARKVRVEAYFEEPVPVGVESAARGAGAELLGREAVAAEDWLATYRELARPIRVGHRLVLDPRDPDDEAGADASEEGEPAEDAAADGARVTLRIPARGAFGTGSHESTRLVLELLEGMELDGNLAGRRVLDVGCGTGILSFAALAFGARSAVAFDVDPAAPFHARANARLNARVAAAPSLLAGTLASLRLPESECRFDLALVNVIPERILPEIGALGPLLAPGAAVLFSGILTEAGEWVAQELAAAGYRRVGAREAGEWVAFETVWSPDGLPDDPEEGRR
jgi:ribosomal protein L11 methyltransferase